MSERISQPTLSTKSSFWQFIRCFWHSEREDFGNALGDYLDDQGYKLKDIEKIEGSAEKGMLVLYFSDGKTVTFKKTIWGWEVIECYHNAYPTVRV